MTTKSEFMELLERLEINSDGFKRAVLLIGLESKAEETIKQALRESHALRQEPSDEMCELGSKKGFENSSVHRKMDAKNIFKAMRDQLIKDVSNS